MRRGVVVIVLAVAATPVATSRAAAKKAKTPKNPTVVSAETPLGLQGFAGAGGNVVIPFMLFDRHGRLSDVEVEYGWDVNGDGKITDGTETVPPGAAPYSNEFFAATEDQDDVRNTRADRPPKLYASSRLPGGGANSFVWKSMTDLGSGALTMVEYKLTTDGHRVPDPDNPGAYLFATGPNGDPISAGVRVRVRAFKSFRSGFKLRRRNGPWVYTDIFPLDNDHHPSATLDSVANDGASRVLVNWTAFDDDSEDLNGNGALDVAQREDLNNDGILEAENVGCAFDWHRLAAGENPSSMTPAQLEALPWNPCTRDKSVGDTNEMDARPGRPIPVSGDLAGVPTAPTGVGRHWVFAWNSAADVGATTSTFILRAQPFDVKRRQGTATYWTSAVTPGR